MGYKRTVASDGNTIYSKSGPITDSIKKIKMIGKTPESISSDIARLKKTLEDANAEQRKIMKQAADPTKRAETNEQKKGRIAHTHELTKTIHSCVKQLKKLGVGVKMNTMDGQKIQYIEGGQNDMLTLDEIKSMKVDVYRDASAGKISGNFKNALLGYLEYVQADLELTEKVSENIQEQRDEFTEFVEAAYDNGYITMKQRDVMLELAGDDELLYEDPNDRRSRMDNLILSYLEAAAEGDEEKKEEVKDKMEEEKESSDSSDDDSSDSDTDDSVVQALKDKAEGLKVNLTDEEKEILDKIEEKISKKMDKDDSKDSSESDSDSVAESVSAAFNGIAPKGFFERDELDQVLMESVNDGTFTDEDADRIREALDKYYGE